MTPKFWRRIAILCSRQNRFSYGLILWPAEQNRVVEQIKQRVQSGICRPAAALGVNSGSFISYSGFRLSLDNNPWLFCFDRDEFDMLEEHIGRNVIVEFKTPRRSSMLSCSAIAEITTIYPAEENDLPDVTAVEGSISTIELKVAHGVECGRITNAIHNKSINRTYYMTAQVGDRDSRNRLYVTTR